MTDPNHESKTRGTMRHFYTPIKASPFFKQQLRSRLMAEAVLERDEARIFGLKPTVWVTIGAVIALALVIYGMFSVPHPSVIINTAPLLPQSSVPEPMAGVISLLSL